MWLFKIARSLTTWAFFPSQVVFAFDIQIEKMRIREGKWPGNGCLVRWAMKAVFWPPDADSKQSNPSMWSPPVSRKLVEMNECLRITEQLNEQKTLPSHLTRTSSSLASNAPLKHKQVWKYQQNRISKFIQSHNLQCLLKSCSLSSHPLLPAFL